MFVSSDFSSFKAVKNKWDLVVNGRNVPHVLCSSYPFLQCCLLSLCQDTQMYYQSCQFSMTTLIPYLRTQTFQQESILQITIYQVRSTFPVMVLGWCQPMNSTSSIEVIVYKYLNLNGVKLRCSIPMSFQQKHLHQVTSARMERPVINRWTKVWTQVPEARSPGWKSYGIFLLFPPNESLPPCVSGSPAELSPSTLSPVNHNMGKRQILKTTLRKSIKSIGFRPNLKQCSFLSSCALITYVDYINTSRGQRVHSFLHK